MAFDFASMMKAGQQFLADRLAENNSVTILYSRGANSVTLPVVLGDKLLRVADEYGNVRVERTDADFHVRPSELVLGGSRVIPQSNDSIRLADEGLGVVLYYKAAPVEGEPVYRDRMLGAMYRVHAKLIRQRNMLLDEAGGPLLDESGDYLLEG